VKPLSIQQVNKLNKNCRKFPITWIQFLWQFCSWWSAFSDGQCDTHSISS